MRIWPILWIGISSLAHAGPAAPSAFRAAIAREICTSVTWTRISDATWVARCDKIDRTPDGKALSRADHSVLVFHHEPGAATLDQIALFHWTAQQATRGTDMDVGGGVSIHDERMHVEATGFTGGREQEDWDLSVYPPRKTRAQYGNESWWSHASAPASPTCTVDIARRRDDCTWERPSCEDPASEGWDGQPAHHRTVPVVAFLSRAEAPADPFACAAVYGDDRRDVYFGKNPRHTTFEAVGDATGESGHHKLTLHLRAHDITPAAATRDASWQASDHWEIWIARAGDPNVDWRDNKPAYCAARKTDYIQLIVTPHQDGTIELANGTPKAKGTLTGVTVRHDAPASNGALIVELTGMLEAWATGGAITVAYSDSLDGTKQDTLIGSSRVVWGKPETFGRMGRDLLCHAGAAPAPTTLPWK